MRHTCEKRGKSVWIIIPAPQEYSGVLTCLNLPTRRLFAPPQVKVETTSFQLPPFPHLDSLCWLPSQILIHRLLQIALLPWRSIVPQLLIRPSITFRTWSMGIVRREGCFHGLIGGIRILFTNLYVPSVLTNVLILSFRCTCHHHTRNHHISLRSIVFIACMFKPWRSGLLASWSPPAWE